jgi:hypothetical protein
MTLDVLLNLSWVFFAVAACCGLRGITRATRFRVWVALFLIALTFFPCVSANDDIIRFSDALTLHTHSAIIGVDSRNAARNADYQLQRLLGVLDHFEVRGVFLVSLVAVIFRLSTQEPTRVNHLPLLAIADRSPPLA